MANEKNLKPIRSESEAREKGKNGGIKSGEVRRKKKLLKECMEDFLELRISDKKVFNALRKMGIPEEELNNRYHLTFALFSKALTGDVSAYKEIRDLLGEDTATEHLEDISGAEEDIFGS